MAEVASAFVSLIPSAKGFGKATAAVIDGDMVKVGRSSGGKLSGALSGVLKKGTTAIGVAVGAALGTALFKGFNRLSAIDQANAKLLGLGNSAKTVSKIMDNALASVRGTAFGLDEAATTAAGVVAAGIKPGKQLEGILKTVADTATIAGTSMSDMGTIFGSVAARGKLQGDDMMQLTSRGVPVLAMLAKHYGTTAAAASKMVTKGKVDFKNFAAAMSDGMGGAALKSGNTFKGALANMYAALGRFGAGLLAGVFPIAKQVFGSITVFLDNLTAKVGPIANAFAAKLPGALAVVSAALAGLDLSGFLTKLAPLVDAIKSFVANVIEAGAIVSPTLLSIAENLAPIAKKAISVAIVALTDAFTLLGPAVKGVAIALVAVTKFVSDNQTSLVVFAGIITAVLLPAIIRMGVQAVISGTETAAIWTMLQASAIKATIVSAAQFIAQGAKWMWLGVQAVAGAVKVAGAWAFSAGASMVSAVASTAAAVAKTVAGWILMGLRAGVNAVRIANAWAVQASAAIRTAVLHPIQTAKIIGGWIAMAANSAVNAVKIAASWVVTSAAAIAAGVVHAAQVAGQVAKWTVLAVLGAGRAAPRVAAGWAVTAASAVAAGAVHAAQVAKQVAGWALLGARSMLAAAKVAAAWLISIGPIAVVIAAVAGLVFLIIKHWDTIKAKTKAAWDWVVAQVKRVPGLLVGFFMNFTLPGLIIKHWDGIKSTFSHGAGAVVSYMKALPGKIVSAMGSLGGVLKDAGINLISGFIRGIESKFSDVKGTLGNLTGKLTSWKGPASLDKIILRDSGKFVIDGFIVGLESRYSDVQSSLGDFTSSLVDSVAVPKGARFDASAHGSVSGSISGAPSVIQNNYAAPGMNVDQFANASSDRLLFALANS